MFLKNLNILKISDMIFLKLNKNSNLEEILKFEQIWNYKWKVKKIKQNIKFKINIKIWTNSKSKQIL
jgi:hypothetical protein